MVIKTSAAHPASFCDSHIHTRLCNHATGEMEEYVRAAIGRRLPRIIFLEHMEEGINHLQGKTWLSEEDFDCYFAEGRRLQALYRSRIEIGLGVECGYNPEYCDLLIQRLGRRNWDQVGVSCHFLRIEGVAHHLNMVSRRDENIRLARQVGAERILARYFADLTEAVRRLPGTMVCHLDAALRYLPELSLTESQYLLIDELLQAIRDNGMAIELNSSGFAIRGEQFPNRRILAMARAYDIPFVFGSDAHRPEEVGRHFNRLSDLLLAEHLL
jgi:histidinol-phosphatase (PHP family)